MEIKGKVHCLFEQSGTFKRQFICAGIPAEDYDLQDNFGETDHRIDLFAEIEKAYGGGDSIFDGMGKDDLIMAFFPCIYFCANNSFLFDGTSLTYQQKGYSELEIDELVLQRGRERQRFWEILLMLFAVCTKKGGLRLIVENPYSTIHYLHNNFPYKPKLIDRNRRLRGDYFAKPTQYWFHNCESVTGLLTVSAPKKKMSVNGLSGHIGGTCGETRSLVSPEYARNFIHDFILGKPQIGTELNLF